MFGKVTNIADYGAFVEIEDGVEGLVHVSEMDWTNKNVNPAKVVHIGQEVEVMVLDVDEERRRISLGLKQCQANPWKEFAENYNRGDKVGGQIKSITDFGIFIGLPGNIDGLVHLSDISWDAARRRGGAQLPEGPAARGDGAVDRSGARAHLARHQAARQGSVLGLHRRQPQGHDRAGRGARKSTPRGAIIDLGNGIEGQLRASELGRDRVEDARAVLKVGEEVEAKFTGVDRKSRTISLSIKAKEAHEEAEAVSELPLRVRQLLGHQPGRSAQGAHRLRRRPLKSAMTKSELIEIITAKQKHLPAKDVELALKQILEIMSDALSQGERIEIRGFGSFSLHFRPPRQGRNPKTGEAVALSGKHVPHFKPGKDLRERVNDGRGPADPRLSALRAARGARRLGRRAVIARVHEPAIVAGACSNCLRCSWRWPSCWSASPPISSAAATAPRAPCACRATTTWASITSSTTASTTPPRSSRAWRRRTAMPRRSSSPWAASSAAAARSTARSPSIHGCAITAARALCDKAAFAAGAGLPERRSHGPRRAGARGAGGLARISPRGARSSGGHLRGPGRLGQGAEGVPRAAASVQLERAQVAAHYLCELAEQALLQGEAERAGTLLRQARTHQATLPRADILDRPHRRAAPGTAAEALLLYLHALEMSPGLALEIIPAVLALAPPHGQHGPAE